MGIGSINNYNSIFQNYRVPSIPVVSPEEIKRQQEAVASQQPVTAYENPFPAVEERKPNPQVEEISLGFRKEDDYGYLGQDADITVLDKPAVMADSRKDSVLKDYQYFVGSSKNLMNETPDGLVIPKF